MARRRLFVAIDLPLDCRDSLEHVNPGLVGVPWQRRDKLHITLSFLGQIEAAAEERLKQALSHIAASPFDLEIRGVGTFGERYPKVLWADIGEGKGHLMALQAKVEHAIAEAGLLQDTRPFHPHVTLSRTRNISRTHLSPFLERYKDVTFGKFNVRELVLYASETGPEGSAYQVMMKHGLEV